MRKMTEEQIAKHNAKVDYNKSGLGIIGDIFSFLIFPPILIYIIYRRVKYSEFIQEDS